MYLVNSTQHKM